MTVGTTIQDWLLGGFAVDNAALNRFFSLHYLLPFVIAGVVVLHIWALHVPGNNNPLGIAVKGPQDTVPFHPYYTVKDLFALSLFVIFYCAVVFYAPEFFGNPDNNIPANPLVTPTHIVPEWYLLPFYAILRSIPDKLIGVIAMFASIAVLFVLPWLDNSKVRSGRFRPLFQLFFYLLMIDGVVLGYVGGNPPEEPLLTIGRFATAYYFAHFLVILPLLGIIEKPRKLPESIANPVLPKGDAAKTAQPA
jgi:ubiquinol-cytochrome c reductase cytochrome b subunit